MQNPSTLDTIVAKVIADMSEYQKAEVVNTEEEDLIIFHYGWGTGIRNHYGLLRNSELLKALGVEHASDASMKIIKAVWRKLRDDA